MVSKREKLLYICAAGLLLFLSFIPRFYDIHKFLPYYSIDENDIVEFAVGFIGGDMDPHWYKYGPLYAYVLSLLYYVQALISGTGIDRYLQDIFFNAENFYYTARFMNSVLNILLGYLTFLISRRFFYLRAAYIALILVVFPFADILVNFKIRVDTLLAVWLTLAVYFSLIIYEHGHKSSYLWTGLFFGLSLATKPLPALLILPTIFFAHYFRNAAVLEASVKKDTGTRKKKKKRKEEKRQKITVFEVMSAATFDKKIWQLLGIAILAAVFANPYSVLNASGFINEQIAALKTEGERAFIAGWDMRRFFPPLGVPFVIGSVMAVIYSVAQVWRTGDKTLLILISFPIFFWLAFARGAARDYFYVPMIPVLIVVLAKAIDDISVLISGKINRFAGNIWILGAVIFLIVFPVISLATESNRLNEHSDYSEFHSEFAAKKWIIENIPSRSHILLYGYYVTLPRLVDYDPNQQAQFGEYFMYSRWQNEYLKKQFIEAHRRYINEGNPAYDLENIRSRQMGKEHLLYNYCLNNQIKYIVSNFDLSAQNDLSRDLIAAFTRANYAFGTDVYIYQVRSAVE